MKTTFEDRLLAELRREVEQSTSARQESVRRRLFTPRRAALGLAACAVAAAVGVVPGAHGGSSAYAVEKHPNGTVTVTLQDRIFLLDHPEEQEALAAKLRTAGVRARVQTPPKGYRCAPSKSDNPRDADQLAVLGRASKARPAPEATAGQQVAKSQAYRVVPKAKQWNLTLRPGDSLVMRNVQKYKTYSAMMYFLVNRDADCELIPLGMDR